MTSIESEVEAGVRRVRELAKEMNGKSEDAMFTDTVAWMVIAARFAESLSEEELTFLEKIANVVHAQISGEEDHGDDEKRRSRSN